MKLITLALILSGVSTHVEAMDFHRGSYSTLKLHRISQQELSVWLNGYVVITGKIEAVWEAGDDGVPMYPTYLLFPDADAAEKLPTLDDYRVTSIDIRNGAEALRLVAGPDVARAFEQREILRVTAVGRFKLVKVGMGIACDRLHVGARVEQSRMWRSSPYSRIPRHSPYADYRRHDA